MGPSQLSNQPCDAGHRYNGEKVILDPYAHTILSRRQYGALGPDLQYDSPDVLGLSRTWPQAAAALPGPEDAFDWEGG